MNTIIFSLLFSLFSPDVNKSPAEELVGAWESITEDMHIVRINSEKHFAYAVYDLKNKKFNAAGGGSWRYEKGKLIDLFEFNSANPDVIGQEVESVITIRNKKLNINSTKKEDWTRVDDGSPGKLAGAWLITGRGTGDEFRAIQPGARRTMKILSGKRFQWIAYNVETREFLGTGGGTYTTTNGKYTENIEFFSRDNDRVGASLVFDYSLEDGNWRHRGSSSKGDPIDEVWSRRETLNL